MYDLLKLDGAIHASLLFRASGWCNIEDLTGFNISQYFFTLVIF